MGKEINRGKMVNIIFYSLSGSRSDWITDGLLYGLKKLYNVIDIPKRKSLYEDSSKNNFYANRNFWHFGDLVDDVNREIVEPDLMIYDSAALYRQSKIPTVYLLTNDPFSHSSYPNAMINKSMAIREKCMWGDEINRKEINDFPLYFTTFKEDCKYVDSSLREGIWVSFLFPTKEREEIIKEFSNTKYDTKEDYYNSLRKAKYGISVYGKGFLCQRDAEIAGNCLLCRKRHTKWEYTNLDYKDGQTCIEFSTIKELKEKMKYYDEHPEEYEILLKNCYNHTIKYFTHEAQAKRFVKWAIYERIEGWLFEEEYDFLKEFCKDKDVLEVGSYKGKSTACIASVANSVIAIDSFRYLSEVQPQVPFLTTITPFLQNISQFNNIITIIGKSVDVSKNIKDNSKDVIFIDASHEYEDVKDDIKVWLPKLKKGGYMLFHDYCYDSIEGVVRAVDEWRKPEKIIKTIAVVKK